MNQTENSSNKSESEPIDLNDLKLQQIELLKLQVHVQQSLSKIEQKLNTFSSKRKRERIKSGGFQTSTQNKFTAHDKHRRSCDELISHAQTELSLNLKKLKKEDLASPPSRMSKNQQKLHKMSILSDQSLSRISNDNKPNTSRR